MNEKLQKQIREKAKKWKGLGESELAVNEFMKDILSLLKDYVIISKKGYHDVEEFYPENEREPEWKPDHPQILTIEESLAKEKKERKGILTRFKEWLEKHWDYDLYWGYRYEWCEQ